ncbi:MAG: AAA family ATPase [Thermoplasmata archaeon]
MIEDSTPSAETFYKIGKRLYEKGNVQEALKNYAIALAIKPDYLDVYKERLTLFSEKLNSIEMEEEKKFIDYINNHTKFSEEDMEKISKDYWRNGNKIFESKDYFAAIRYYNFAIFVNPHYTDAYFNRGLTFLLINEYHLAEKDITTVIKLENKKGIKHEDTYIVLSDIKENQNNLKSAKKYILKALSINPNSSNAKERLNRISLMEIEKNISKKHKSAPPDNYINDLKNIIENKNSEHNDISVNEEVIKDKTGFTGEINSSEGQLTNIPFYISDKTFNDVVGMEKLKKYMYKHIILPIKNPLLYRNEYPIDFKVGLILVGPPGVGKSYIVQALAGELKIKMIFVSLSKIVDMYTGNTEKNIHKIFETARNANPCILFLDELESLAMNRMFSRENDNSSIRTVDQLLAELDGINTTKDQLYVIGSTNTPWDLDPAIIRSGRLSDIEYVPKPNKEERKNTFMYYTKDLKDKNIDYDLLAELTEWYSQADIKRITKEAYFELGYRHSETNEHQQLTTQDLVNIIKEIGTPSLLNWYLNFYNNYKEGKIKSTELVLYEQIIKDSEEAYSYYLSKNMKKDFNKGGPNQYS